MTRIIIPLALVGFLGIGFAHAGQAKTVLCHIPPGNPTNFFTIEVRDRAVDSHLKHGDLMGSCDIPAAERCDDGNQCTIGTFLPGTVFCDPNPNEVVCNDQITCTNDACEADRGCVFTVACPAATPVCDPNATGSNGCTGTEGECPLEAIAEFVGWEALDLQKTECVQTIQTDLAGNIISTKALNETRTNNLTPPRESTASVVEGGNGDDIITDLSGPDLDLPEGGVINSGYVVSLSNNSYTDCSSLFTDPTAAETCLAGECTNPTIPGIQ